MQTDFSRDAVASGPATRPVWERPELVEFDITSATEITNCGTGSDGVICSAPPS